METANIVNLLKNSGLNHVSISDGFVIFQDPGCILPAFDTVLEVAWVVVLILLGIMLFGWGMLYIRNGVKLESLFENAKSIILILAVLAVVKPIVNVVYGNDLFGQQCEMKQVSLNEVQKLLKLREQKLGKNDAHQQYEIFEVTDSGVIQDDIESVSQDN